MQAEQQHVVCLADLPALLLGLITRASAVSAGYHHLGAVNLVCRATHAAMPDAFSAAAARDDGDAAAAALEDAAFTSQASATGAALWEGGWGPPPPHPGFGAADPDAAQPRAAIPNADIADAADVASFIGDLTLQLALDTLGDAALTGVPLEASLASLRRTAQRFSAAPRLCLTLQRTAGVLGGHLFCEHAAPLLRRVRHLTLLGPRHFGLPPLWRAPAAAAFFSRVTHLTVVGHHSGVAPLAAELPVAFPFLTALHLVADTCLAMVEQRLRRCESLSIVAPPTLRMLLVSFVETLSRVSAYGEDGGGAPDAGYQHTLTLLIRGSPGALQVLGVNSGCWADFRIEESDRESRGAVKVEAELPALQRLNVTIPTIIGYNRDACRSMLAALPHMCPALVSLVLVTRSLEWFERAAWVDFLAALAPVAGGLLHLELQHEVWDTLEHARYLTASGLRLLLEAALPAAEVRVLQQGPCFRGHQSTSA